MVSTLLYTITTLPPLPTYTHTNTNTHTYIHTHIHTHKHTHTHVSEYVETGRQQSDVSREMVEALAAIDMIRTWTMRVHDKEVDPATEQVRLLL
jgi:hypothetical protein